MTPRKNVDIIEHYVEYQPPFDATRLCARLLKHVPEQYVSQLRCVVLTNQSGNTASHRKGKVRTRGRKIPKDRVRGYYHPRWQNEEPWIELYVDKIHDSMKKLPRWMPLVKELEFASVLFHEVGHHIHYEKRPQHREKEDVADDWSKWLVTRYIRGKYWYLLPLLLPVSLLFKLLQRFRFIPR